MAKDDNEKDGEILPIIITIVIILFWLAVFAIMIKVNAFGLGNTLRPILKNVPVVNKILPAANDEETAAESDYSYKNLQEAIDRIKELEKEVDNKDESIEALKAQNEEYAKEIERLKIFEENQLAFEETRKKFNEEVVFNDKAPDIEQYKSWYETFDPTTAEAIYREVLAKITYSEQVKEFASTYSAMKPAQAAKILETMTGDLDVVVDILANMTSEQRGQILGNMDTAIAAKITKKMLP